MQLDQDEEGPVHGTLDAELEVQRTIKRAELTAFLCLLQKVVGPIKVRVDNKGIIDEGCGEEKENASTRKLAMLTCGSRFLGTIVPFCLTRYCAGSGAR